MRVGQPFTRALFAHARELESQRELDELMRAGREGAPRRVVLRAGGSFGAGCVCPPFSIDFSRPADDEAAAIALLPVTRGEVPSVGDLRANLEFILVGFFSGEHISTYEYFRAIHPESDAGDGWGDDEERHVYPLPHPELCLEAWCYAPRRYGSDPDAGSVGDDDLRFLRGVANEHASSLAKRGIPRCVNAWLGPLR